MGSIKNTTVNNDEAKSHPLQDDEFKYVLRVNEAKTAIADSISAFLHYIAVERMGYESTDSLQFELDFSDPKHVLKVTKLAKS